MVPWNSPHFQKNKKLGRVRVSILESIDRHEDLLALNDRQRSQLCQEIRCFLIEHVSKTGGHLASNLGVVELTVAIETVFNTEKDRLVFDVGHQSYVHKLLTGRQADFDTLRTFGGIAGFPKPSESDSDAFVAGHASSSVSIALGMARARTLQKQDYQVVALLGDGAATGGMFFEGLGDAAESGEPLVVILNDNEMSIHKNVGGIAKHFSKLRMKSGYLGAKQKYRALLSRVPGGQWIFRVTRAMKEWARRVLIPTTVFENMGVAYYGPVDGHDLNALIPVLRNAKEMGRPVVVHVITQKGKGYAPAEESPADFHGVGKFDPDTGAVSPKNSVSFSESFGSCMCALAGEDERVCAITAAMPGGTGLLGFKESFPDRLFDVGIAEEHAVSMAGGLAKQGMVPVVALYSTFLQRSFDMLMQDIALLQLHVVLAVDRAGLVGEDGETHHGVFDVGFLRQVPGMQILCPASTAEQKDMLTWAVKDHNGPVAVRYPRGGNRWYEDSCWPHMVYTHSEGDDAAIITYGILVEQAVKAAELLAQHGKKIRVVRLLRVSPVPAAELKRELKGIHNAFVLEETTAASGIGQALAGLLEGIHVTTIDLGDGFVTHGSISQLYSHCGIDADSVAKKILEVIRHEN